MYSKEIELAMRLLEELFKTMNQYLKAYDNSHQSGPESFYMAKSNYQWIRRYYENVRELNPKSFDFIEDYKTQAALLIEQTGWEDGDPEPLGAKDTARQLLEDLMPGVVIVAPSEAAETDVADFAETTAALEQNASGQPENVSFGLKDLLYGWIPFFGYPMALYWFSQKKKKRASFFVAYSTIGILSMVYLMR